MSSANPFANLFSAYPSSFGSASTGTTDTKEAKPLYPAIGTLFDFKKSEDQTTLRAVLQKIPKSTLATVVNAFISEYKIEIENTQEKENMQAFLTLNEQLPTATTTEDILKLTDEIKHWSYESVSLPKNFLAMGAMDRVFDEIVRHWEALDKDAFENITSKYAFVFNKISKRRDVDTYEKLQKKYNDKENTDTVYDYLLASLMKGSKKKDKKDKETGASKAAAHEAALKWFAISAEEKEELFSYIEDKTLPQHNCGNPQCYINGRHLDMSKQYTYQEWMCIADKKRTAALVKKNASATDEKKTSEKEKEATTTGTSAAATATTTVDGVTFTGRTEIGSIAQIKTNDDSKLEATAKGKDQDKDGELPALVDDDLETDSDEELPHLEEIKGNQGSL